MKKLVESKVDIDNINDDGYNKFGYIAQLFGIFKDNIKYCFKECKRLYCNKWKRYCIKWYYIKSINNNLERIS